MGHVDVRQILERVGAHGVLAAARSAAMAFIADTFAVGIAGLAAPWRGDILDTGICRRRGCR
ncbi:MAG: hypothetical protein WA709_30305 [Stellaceae bacterium]